MSEPRYEAVIIPTKHYWSVRDNTPCECGAPNSYVSALATLTETQAKVFAFALNALAEDRDLISLQSGEPVYYLGPTDLGQQDGHE